MDNGITFAILHPILLWRLIKLMFGKANPVEWTWITTIPEPYRTWGLNSLLIVFISEGREPEVFQIANKILHRDLSNREVRLLFDAVFEKRWITASINVAKQLPPPYNTACFLKVLSQCINNLDREGMREVCAAGLADLINADELAALAMRVTGERESIADA